MEIVVCFLRHTFFLPVRWPHLCAPKNLSRVTFSMAGRLVNLLVVEVLGVCVLFGFYLFFYFFSFFPSFPCTYGNSCGACASSLRAVLGTVRLGWGYHRASGKSLPWRHETFPDSSSHSSLSSFFTLPSCPAFPRGGETHCFCS